MGFFDNPITNPFYREPEDDNPDALGLGKIEHDSQNRADRVTNSSSDPDKHQAVESVSSDEDVDGETTRSYQDGLRKAEAVAIAWGKPSLIMSYVGIYLIFFFVALQSSTQSTLQPYVYSSFALHSLLTISNIMSGIIGGVFRIPTSKIIDIWGRPQGFLLMMGFMILGIILQAATKNVETYAAGQVFYWLGNDGVQYVLDVIISDTSSLRNRALMLSFSTTPYIATVFAGPALGEHFVDAGMIAWGFGIFTIVLPVIAIPLGYLFLANQRKAERAGLFTKTVSGRTFSQGFKHYFIEFDVIGIFILVTGLVMFLLPFQLAADALNGWDSPTVIALIVVGFLLIAFFPIYEAFLAPKSFIPWRLLRERTVLGACLQTGALFISFYCWDAYFTSFLQVVYGLSIKDAGYVANIYDIGSCFWGIVVGFLIRQTGRYKWLAMIAVPLYMLGAGLMIYFRNPDQPLGYIIMCQIFIAIAGGTLQISNQIAAMAANKHGDVAVILALLAVSSSIGGAIGSAVSGAIWTNTFEPALMELLPASEQANIVSIVGLLTTQLSYPIGSPTRDAIIAAYGRGVYRQCIASTCFTIIPLIGVWMWRDVRVDNKKQVKGNVA